MDCARTAFRSFQLLVSQINSSYSYSSSMSFLLYQLNVASEERVLRSVLRWARADPRARLAHLLRCLSAVRLEHVAPAAIERLQRVEIPALQALAAASAEDGATAAASGAAQCGSVSAAELHAALSRPQHPRHPRLSTLTRPSLLVLGIRVFCIQVTYCSICSFGARYFLLLTLYLFTFFIRILLNLLVSCTLLIFSILNTNQRSLVITIANDSN